MTRLEWKPDYATGDAAVDYEHRELIKLINDLLRDMGENADAKVIEEVLGDIHSSISAHFALEEALMRHANYDEYEAHKEDHEQLLEDIRSLTERFTDDSAAVLDSLQQELVDWFGNHFATFDARLHKRLGAK